MKLRWLLPAALAVLLLAGCAPDPVAPAAGSASPHPTEHVMPTESPATDAPNDRYDY